MSVVENMKKMKGLFKGNQERIRKRIRTNNNANQKIRKICQNNGAIRPKERNKSDS